MAYAPARSCREALEEGATDNGIWKPTPDRGGVQTSPSIQHQTGVVFMRENAMRGVLGQRGEC